MKYGHHTKEQAQAAFKVAQEILEELTEAGVDLPSFEIFVDGSCRVRWHGNLTPEQLTKVMDLVHSQRFSTHEINSIESCCGLVTEAGNRGYLP